MNRFGKVAVRSSVIGVAFDPDVLSVYEFPEDVLGEMVSDLTMAGHRLTGSASGVLIPIVTTAVSDEDAPVLLDLADQINPLHAICSSATFRTPGM